MKRCGQKEHSKQGDIKKTNLYLNNTYSEAFKTLLWFNYCSGNILSVCACVCVWLTQLKLQKRTKWQCPMHVNYVFLNVRFFLCFDAIAVFETGKSLTDKVYWGKECLHNIYILWRLTAVGEDERVIVFSLEVTLERVC